MFNTIKKNLQSLNIKQFLNQPVFRNILLVTGITLFIKVIGFYKESVVAANFGLSELLDTFFIAFLIPGFLYNIFLGPFKSVFIPNYIAELKTGNNMASFQSTGFLVTAMVGLLFIIIAFLFTDIYLENIFADHTQEYYELVKSQFYYLLPCIILWGFSSLLSGLLNVNEEFKFSSFYGVFIPVSIIVCLSFFKDILGNNVLAIGTLIGSFSSFVFLLTVCIQKKILALSRPDRKNINARLMFSQIPAKVSSSFLTGLHEVVDQYFAAQLIVGSIAALNYGLKIPAFAMGIIIIGMSNVLLPYFSKLVVTEKEKAFDQLFKLLKLIFIGTSIIVR